MSLTPEYGEEELLGKDEEGVLPRRPPPPPGADTLENEIEERGIEAHQRRDLDAEANELHVAGQICERCGGVITARQDARRRLDGGYVHEVCPPTAAPRNTG